MKYNVTGSYPVLEKTVSIAVTRQKLVTHTFSHPCGINRMSGQKLVWAPFL